MKLTALLIVVTSLPLVSAQTSRSAYQGPVQEDPALHAPKVRPLWRVRLDAPTAVVADGTVYYLRDGRLVAATMATGARLWTHGSGLNGPLAYADDRVLVAQDDRVVALNAHDGQPEWVHEADATPVRHLEVHGDALVVAGGAAGGTVLDVATGALRYRLDVPGAGTPVHVGEDLLVWRALYGEPHALHLHAFDLATGEPLWRTPSRGALLAIENGLAYLLDESTRPTPRDAPPEVRIDVIDARTGERRARWVYGIDTDTIDWRPLSGAAVILTHDAVLVESSDGEQVVRFPRGGADAPTATYAARGGGSFLTGPFLDLLFFETSDGRLLAVHLPEGRTIDYLPSATPLSRLDLIGRRAYAGRTDGTFLAVDLDTARPRYLLRTEGFGFGETLDAGPYVVVQGSEELLVVEDPP